jgi:RimJ/RimL family protein N-acetyltransferase
MALDLSGIAAKPMDLERVRLRRIERADGAALYDIHSNDDVARYMARPAMRRREEADELIDRVHKGYETNTILQLAIERKADRELIGYCLLFNFNERGARAEIGYALGRPHWGRGYMHEALVALVELAFGRLDLNRLEADIDPRNKPSARSLERLGFEKEGVLRERWKINGEASDSVILGLLRREWLSRPSRPNPSPA